MDSSLPLTVLSVHLDCFGVSCRVWEISDVAAQTSSRCKVTSVCFTTLSTTSQVPSSSIISMRRQISLQLLSPNSATHANTSIDISIYNRSFWFGGWTSHGKHILEIQSLLVLHQMVCYGPVTLGPPRSKKSPTLCCKRGYSSVFSPPREILAYNCCESRCQDPQAHLALPRLWG